MGAASCKNSKSSPAQPPSNQPKENTKNITIGVFGLDDAGKTSTVKVIEGVPTNRVVPTVSSTTTMVTNPLSEKNKNQQRIQIIDVSGAKKFRQQSWSQYYGQIHGLIFVIDASERNRLNENRETLEDLLDDAKLKNKPILILANKQDQRGAIDNENDLKRKLEIEKLKAKYRIELCTALPPDRKNKVDESIRQGFSWLIQTIDNNYTELNAYVTKAKSTRTNTKFNRSESDENDSDNKYSKEKNASYTTKNGPYGSRMPPGKLPKIDTNKNKTKSYSDDDDNNHNYSTPTNGLIKKNKVLGGTSNNDRSIKTSGANEPKAFRAPYESFPEDTPWSLSSTIKPTKSDDTLPRLYPKVPTINDTRKRDISPLVRDTKPNINYPLSKRDNDSENDDDFDQHQKLKPTNRFSPSIKKPSSGIYGDDIDDYYNKNARHTITTPKKSYNDDDDDYNKSYQRSSDRFSKPTNRSKNDSDDDDRSSSYPRKETRSKYDDDDNHYPSSKPVTRSTYNNNYSNTKSKPSTRSDDDDDDDHRWSSSKQTTRSKFEDDEYSPSSSKAITRSNYNNDDDDDDRFRSSSKKTNYNGNNSSRDDFFTSKDGPNTSNRFRKTTGYDS